MHFSNIKAIESLGFISRQHVGKLTAPHQTDIASGIPSLMISPLRDTSRISWSFLPAASLKS